MHTSQTGLGFNPFHAVAKAAKGAVHIATHAVTHPISTVESTAKAAGRDVVKVGKVVGRAALTPAVFAAHLAEAATRLALRPVTSRVRTLENRRANKIAWDKRKSKTPTPAERAEAKSWTKAQLRKKLPHGPLLAMLAGPLPMPTGLGAMSTNLGIAPAVIAALIPVFIEILNVMLKSFAKSGEAPVQINPDGSVSLPPGVDPTAVPDSAADMGPPPGSDADAQAAAAAAAGMPDAGGGDDAGDGGGGAMVPGGKKGNLIMIGGLVVGVILVASLFKSKPKKS